MDNDIYNKKTLTKGNDLHSREAEGGCGVIGIAASVPIAGKFLVGPLERMHNRGNGKGGGLAAIGCFPERKNQFAIQVGYLDSTAVNEIENNIILPNMDIFEIETLPTVDDYRDVEGIEVKPPSVVRYFCKVKDYVLENFIEGLKGLRDFRDRDTAEEEFIFRLAGEIHDRYYPEEGRKRAFVLSHGKNMIVLKGVGYAESIARYYLLDDFQANIWIGHQRYPTRGRVWHPGGAHPFIGIHSALVHNGDLANYHSIEEYLLQRNLETHFQTDTEVAALLFDYYTRTLNYPLEYTIEALAPTTEHDFNMLPKVKQRLYRAIRAAHIHGSPDGPWFFIIARNNVINRSMELIAITDTSMLRPQVFAYSSGKIDIGLVASEKQAIDSFLENYSIQSNYNTCPIADQYWVARGGSHTDGGAFIFAISHTEDDADNKSSRLVCTDKFGRVLELPGKSMEEPSKPSELFKPISSGKSEEEIIRKISSRLTREKPYDIFRSLLPEVIDGTYESCAATLNSVPTAIKRADEKDSSILKKGVELLTLFHDRRINCGEKKRKWLTAISENALKNIFDAVPGPDNNDSFRKEAIRFTFKNTHLIENFSTNHKEHIQKTTVIIDASGFPVDGRNSAASFLRSAFRKGFRFFYIYKLAGHRFLGCGLGPDSTGTVIHLYGSSGDYAGSGLDGAELHIHGDAQDQVGQILKSGTIIIHGNVGQTFLYGAKGGSAYVLGNAAGRALINAVGSVRVVINGTCLDYAAESFMAGKETGGGFLIINGLRTNIYGEVIGMENRFPGGNFFSLASGGAGYINDPYHSLTEDHLNGAKFTTFTQEDWQIIKKYLEKNENIFGISINGDILTVDRIRKWPQEIFRKVVAA